MALATGGFTTMNKLRAFTSLQAASQEKHVPDGGDLALLLKGIVDHRPLSNTSSIERFTDGGDG